MAIGKIITGQTFGNWLNTTNLLIDEVNQATPTYSQGKLVRWGAGGSVTVKTLSSNTIALSSGATVNNISTFWASPVDDATLMTSNAVHGAILNADTIRLVHPTRVTSDIVANTITLFAQNVPVITVAEKYSIGNYVAEFDIDVELNKDLVVKGTRTELDIVSLEVEDSNIELNKGTGSKFAANNAGIDIASTNAFIRLINTGTEFPVTKNMVIQFQENGKYLEVDRNDSAGFIAKGTIDINEKDRLVLKYYKPSLNNPQFYKTEELVLGIGDTSWSDVTNLPYPYSGLPYTRETGVLEPSTGEIEYSIVNTTLGVTQTFPSYSQYKSEFANTTLIGEGDTNAFVQISIDADRHRTLHYWLGTITPTSRTEEVIYNTTGGVTEILIDDPAGGFIEHNPTIEMYTGDFFKFEINFTTTNAFPFFISSKPFSDPTRTNVNNIYYTNLATHTASEPATYEIDGTHYPSYTDYMSYFEGGANQLATGTANVVFRPSQPGTYYYWTTANSAQSAFNMGGTIIVYKRNENMGNSIQVGYPLGKNIVKNVTYDPGTQEFLLDNIGREVIDLEAGDTVRFNITNPNHATNVFTISNTSVAGNELDYVGNNVLYLADGSTEYKIWSDYANNFSSNGYSNVIFTPFDNGTPFPQIYYYYANNNPNAFGVIRVLQPKPYDLGAYHMSTDNFGMTIENPIKFSVTQNKYPVMELDGELADFFGTKNGIRLPNNSFDYTPNSNGIIRYNDALHLFEGYTQGQWRGLGGVVDLNQDTYVETDDFNDTIYFVANNANVSQMRETDMFFDTNRITIDTPTPGTTIIKDSHIRVESNANTLNYSVYVEGTANTNVAGSYTVESGRTGLVIDQRGVKVDSSGYFQLPYGNDNDRPYVAANGMIRMAEDGLRIVDASGNVDNFDILELYAEGKWNPLSYVTNEYVRQITVTSNTVDYTNLYVPFRKEEIDVYINGLKLIKSDYNIINTTSHSYAYNAVYNTVTNRYDYFTTGGVPTTITPILDAGDTLTISYTITDNTAPVLIGIDDPLNPGNPLPTISGATYDINGVIQATINDYKNNFFSSNTVHANTANVTFTPTVNGQYYAFAENVSSILFGSSSILSTGRTSYTSTLDFAPYPRLPGQTITVNHKPGREIGVVTINAVSRSELLNGYGSNVNIAGSVSIGSGQVSTSTITGALVVNGGLGMSGDLFVGKSITELSAGELKTNVTEIDSALDKIISMRGVEFNWKDDEFASKEYGLIADDVAKVVPNLVSFQNGIPQGVKYSKVVALLIEAMKQQQNEIETLKSRLPKKRGRKTNNTQG